MKVHDYCARVHQSNFRIVKEKPAITLTVADRTAYAKGLMAGPQTAAHVRQTAIRGVQLDQHSTVSTKWAGRDLCKPNETAAQLTIVASYAADIARARMGTRRSHGHSCCN